LLVKATTTLHHSLGLFLPVENHQLLAELLIWHTKFLPDLDQASEAIDVVGVIVVDFLVHFKCLIKQIHPSVAGGDHQLPLYLFGLDLRGSLEVENGLFKHVLFGVVHTETRDHVDFGGVVSVTFLVIVNSLKLILLLLVKVTHLCKNLRVCGHLGNEDVIPFESLSSHSDKFINMGDLVNDLITVWNDCVKLLKSLETLIVVVESFVNQSKVIDCLDAICLNSDCLEEELFGSVIVLQVVETVSLVHQGLGIVPIMLDSEVCEGLGIFEVILKEVKEGYVVRSHGHHDLIFLFEALEAFYSSLDFLVFDIVDRLGDFHLTFYLREVGGFQSLTSIIVSVDDVLVNKWSDKFGRVRDV